MAWRRYGLSQNPTFRRAFSVPRRPPRAIPSLDELYAWTSEPDHRVVIRGVDWPFYEQLVDSIPEGANLHVDYDGKDLEIMSLSPIHDGVKKTFGHFVELTADELEIPCTGLGQTTWKRSRGRSRPGGRRLLLLRTREVSGGG